MRSLVFGAVLILLVACSDIDSGDVTSEASRLEITLSTNTKWPYEAVGVLDIVEAGGYEDSRYPSWAVGSLLTGDDEFGVGISIGEGVVSRAGINIDSGKKVKVWLEAPKTEHGFTSYPITRIEAQ